MQKEVALENQGEIKEFNEYDKDKLAIAKVCVLSTAPNSHGLIISEEVLKRDINTIQGQFLVAHMVLGDARSHDAEEVPVGYFIPNKEIEFEEVGEGEEKIVKAWAYAVLSKQYAKEAYDMFVNDNHRATSIEMKIEVSPEDEDVVLSFNAYGSTILGKSIQPSCKDAEVSLIRFAEDATKFFEEQSNAVAELKNFVKTRGDNIAKNKYADHPINSSKEAVYTGEWDGDKAKQNLVKEKKYKTLAPKVCLKLEEGWEDRQVTKLNYPVMGLFDGEWRYSTKALSSAQAYAEQNDETEVLNKIKAIKEKLDLDDSDGKEEKKMSEIEFAAVNIGDLWSAVYRGMRDAREWNYYIHGIYEEGGQKFAIIYDDSNKLYRLDFSLTEEGLTLADEIIEVKEEFIETENMKKFAEPENVADYRFAEEKEEEPEQEDKEDEEEKVEMSADELMAKIAELEGNIEERDNIIMGKDEEIAKRDAELEELRKFKADVEEKEKAQIVESVLTDVANCLSEEQLGQFREEGLACVMSEIDGWSNKVKAVSFEASKNKNKKKENTGIWSFSAPIQTPKKNGLWD